MIGGCRSMVATQTADIRTGQVGEEGVKGISMEDRILISFDQPRHLKVEYDMDCSKKLRG